MKKLIECFAVVNPDGVEIDRFTFMRDNNHATIDNKGGCLFSGYYLESVEKWETTKADMLLVELLGNKIITIK